MLVKNTDDAPVDPDAGWETSPAYPAPGTLAYDVLVGGELKDPQCGVVKDGGARSLLWWTWRDLSLAVRRRGEPNVYDQLFALRCWCGKWFGCSEHWFCGTCDDCQKWG